MKVQFIPFLVLALGLPVLMPATVGADEAADRKAEIERKKAAAKVRADERKKAGEADKKAADERAAAEKKAADAKKVADDKKAEAEKKAADDKKKDGDKLPAGGAGGSGGAAAAAATGSGGKGGAAAAAGAGGSGGKGATDAKKSAADEKDAPLPASDIDTLRKDRGDRRKSTVERLRRRWGRVLGEEKGASDLKLHARRVAFLQRVRVVAEGKKDKKTVEAVDELLTKEDDRHSKAMNTLREGSLTTGAGK